MDRDPPPESKYCGSNFSFNLFWSFEHKAIFKARHCVLPQNSAESFLSLLVGSTAFGGLVVVSGHLGIFRERQDPGTVLYYHHITEIEDIFFRQSCQFDMLNS